MTVAMLDLVVQLTSGGVANEAASGDGRDCDPK